MKESTVAIPAPPVWWWDRAFWSMTATQFLGAFNDNVFKQLVALLCVDLAQGDPARDRQGLAQVLFAAPFILFSGFAGFLSDRYSKRTIVIICKLAEIGIAAAAMAAFGWGGLVAPLIVLWSMGTHSAFFGPPKYGILPELFAEHDLPKVNGAVSMTTFLAIILAFPTAGKLKLMFAGELWKASIACLALAVLGLLTAVFLRRTRPAHPDLRFEMNSLFVHRDTWRAMRERPGLMRALVVSSVFWLTGGVVYPPVINFVGRNQFGLDDYQTGLLASCTGLGIVAGCVIAGMLSREQFRGRLVRIGLWGMLISLLLLAIPGRELDTPVRAPPAMPSITQDTTPALAATGSPAPPAGERPRFRPVAVGLPGTRILLVLLGLSAGLFSVPVQVYLQARAPVEQKGRIIGAMNLFNWIGIALAGAYYQVAVLALGWLHAPNAAFAAAALTMVPLLILYHPRDEPLA